MKTMLLVAILSLSLGVSANAAINHGDSVIAKKDKGHVEPAPKDRDERKGGEETPDSREETYEGNDRTDGGHLDDGDGYGGGEGGMIGELFYVPGKGGNTKTYPVTTNVKKEDRGDVIVYTTTVHEDMSASETCTTVTVTVVDKKSNKVIKTDSNEYCNTWPL